MFCEYGCGQKARYEMTNGKWCCESHHAKCPINRSKNSKGQLKARSEGKGVNLSIEACLKGQETYRTNLEKVYKTLPFIELTLAKQCRIVLKEQKGRCLLCGIKDWLGTPIKLHLDHIDGNNQNQERENLRYICPNCHSQTETYCGRNINKYKGLNKVSDSELIEAIKSTSNTRQALLKSGLAAKGGNYVRVKKLMKQL